ncbi:LysR family transcriptional regulator [Noviherbaspirillum massiliense]|uniref:LysR family transcriptional regulator n=1 Tax=Noviherbaspirillum massiliense TaxID=1465823 RepID=UPI0002F13A84|nr:LysR family transcriptional regulator [Noviherbaspirillum massiliense]
MIPSAKAIQNRLRMRQLALIAALSEMRSLRKVAEHMHLSQPAATKMLHEIEETLGVTLFERLPRGMQPTTYGESVIRYAQMLLSDLDNLRKDLVAQEEGGVGEIRVGSIMAPAPGLLMRAIVDLKERFPHLKISIHMDTSDVLAQMLEQGRLDIVLGRIPSPEHSGLNFEVLDNESLSVIAGNQHPLSRTRRVALADLASMTWILQPPTSPMRQLMERAFQDAGMSTPAQLVETASILATTTLLQETDMVAVVPTSIARHYAVAGMICILPVRLKFQLEPYGIITRKERFPAPAVKLFQETLRRLSLPDRMRPLKNARTG